MKVLEWGSHLGITTFAQVLHTLKTLTVKFVALKLSSGVATRTTAWSLEQVGTTTECLYNLPDLHGFFAYATHHVQRVHSEFEKRGTAQSRFLRLTQIVKSERIKVNSYD